MKKRNTARLGGALAATLALTVAAGGSASAGDGGAAAAQRGIEAEIEIKGGFRNLRFVGPEEIGTGQELTIRNLTQPGGQQGVGPHTFSLVQRDTRPVGKDEIKACGQQFAGICGEIGEWHQVDQQGNVGEPDVDVGGTGWNKRGNFQHEGDSWVTETEDEETTRVMSAPVGRTIHYICAIHPFMKGKFKTVAVP